MRKTLVIAGAVATLSAGAAAGVALAQVQAPAQSAPAAQPAPPPGGPGFRGDFRRGRLTLQEVQARNAATFAQLDADKDGRATFEEFRAFQERQRLERQRRAFQRFSNNQDSITLDQLNARATERYNQRSDRRGGGGDRGRGR